MSDFIQHHLAQQAGLGDLGEDPLDDEGIPCAMYYRKVKARLERIEERLGRLERDQSRIAGALEAASVAFRVLADLEGGG